MIVEQIIPIVSVCKDYMGNIFYIIQVLGTHRIPIKSKSPGKGPRTLDLGDPLPGYF